MKRRFFNITGALAVLRASGLVASASTILTGRGNKNSRDTTRPAHPNNPNTPSGSHDGALVGKWYTRYDAEVNLEDQLEYEFRSDGTFLCMGMDGFTFSASDGIITIVLGGRINAGSATYKINGTALTLSHGGGYYLTNGTYYKK
jgi:hypothetical protein